MSHDFLSSVFLLLLLLDPLGNIPFLLSLLRRIPAERRRRIVLRESLIAAAVLVCFVFVGDRLLAAMRLSDSALEISGGIILFLIALRMVFPPPAAVVDELEAPAEPFVVPLAIPMIAGPSVLATVLLAARQGDQPWMLIAAILSASLMNTALLLSGDWFSRLFGRPGLEAMERMMGLVLTALAVQMLTSGIKTAFNLQ
jgi:MarC family membrane protein